MPHLHLPSRSRLSGMLRPALVRQLTPRLLRRLLLLLLGPFTAFWLCQLVLEAPSLVYAPGIWLANAACIGVIYYPLCALTGQVELCFVLIHLLAGFWGAANYFVDLFRGTPVLPWDFTALGTAAAVARTYDLTPTAPMMAAILLLVTAAAVLRRHLISRQPRGIFPWVARLAMLGAGAACFFTASDLGKLEKLGVKTDVWDPTQSYCDTGAMATFLCNLTFLEVEVPQDYSPEAAEALASLIAPNEGEEMDGRPNVIAIMNESWADFEVFGHAELTESVMDRISSLDNAIFGHAYTSVFGAGTSASEFEFLTGHSMAFLPSGSIPYQQYVLEETDSLASHLRLYGYRAVALHPGERTSWQRDRAYPLMGFEEFLCGEDMTVPLTTAHGYITDHSSYQQIIQLFEEKEEGERLFLFNVTIQNHGAYTDQTFPTQVQVVGHEGEWPMAEQYLTLAGMSQEAFLELVDYFSAQEEPTIILMFGDHQPSVEQEFLDYAYGVTQDQMTMKEYMGKYYVPYVIWANYPLEGVDEPRQDTSLNFLSQILLEEADIPPSFYGRYLNTLRQTLPALTFVGYTDEAGYAYSHLEINSLTPFIGQYQILQYNALFDREHRLDDFFS